MNEYPLGQALQFTARYANNGTPTNPSVTVFKTAPITAAPPPEPTATSAQFGVSSAVLNPATGVFTFDFTPPSSGIWIVQSVGTGVVQAASKPLRFRVLPSPFA